MMHTRIAWPAIAVLALGVCGCNQAQPPDKLQHDLAKATESASEKDAQAAEQLEKADQQASQEVARAEARADQKTADAAGAAVVTKAEGDHRVALALCESMSGQAQEDCRKHADDQLDAVKEKVDQLKQSSPRSVHAPPTRE
jgi:hypothetical protein